MQRSLPRRRWRHALRTAARYADKHPLRLIGAWWAALIAADTLIVDQVTPRLPGDLHGLHLTANRVVAVAALLHVNRLSVRAAFLDGMLWEREHPQDVDLPLASGDDTGGAKVMAFQRNNAGAHRRTPRPRPRP